MHPDSSVKHWTRHSKMNNHHDPGADSDLAILNTAREHYIAARFHYQDNHLTSPHHSTAALQRAIMKYFEVLRPKLKQRSQFWENKPLTTTGELCGLKHLDKWETLTTTTRTRTRTLNGTDSNTQKTTQLMKPEILLTAGRLLDEAYQLLTPAYEPKKKIPVRKYEDRTYEDIMDEYGDLDTRKIAKEAQK